MTNNVVTVLLPCENSSVVIDLEGDTPKEIVGSFKENDDYRINRMIDHLNDCKFD